MVTLSSLSLGPVRRARWGLILLWRSLTIQQRRFFLTILLAGFVADFQRRGRYLQRVTGLFSGFKCPKQGTQSREDEELGRNRECNQGLHQPGHGSGLAERHEESMKRGYLTRPVALGDKGRARSSWALRQQYLRGANCDVIFSVDGRSFPAHRCWVAAFSMPLKAMFNSGMRESQEDIIHLHDTDPATFGLFLDFIYDGAVELSVHNIESVLELSVRYGVGPLVEQCCDFLAGAIDTSNGFGILTLADKYHCQPLRRDALLYVVANFEGCWALDRDGFSRLSKPLVKDILGHDALVPLDGEATVFTAAVAWVQEQMRTSNTDRDTELVNDIFSHVRFALIAPEVLAGEIETHTLMQDEPCRKYVLEAYRLQALTHGDVQHLGPSSSSISTNKTSTQASGAEAARDTVSRALIKAMGERARPRVPLRLEAAPSTASSSNHGGAHTSVLSPRAGEAPRATAVDAWLSCVPEADEVSKQGEGASCRPGSPTRRKEGMGQARPAAEVASVAESQWQIEATGSAAAPRESGYGQLFFGRKDCNGRALSSGVATPRTVSV